MLAIWDEIDSKDDILVYTRIEKKLHGGGAPAYFRDTGVVVKLMPRHTRAKQVHDVRVHRLLLQKHHPVM